ncbi:hypothetical protein [Hymenobacter convexus]|uniref:hypothetical protein n=1 Tax=Hymenobacter sp. CA1UV-4 TaxID=3063782 RepID=UPI00271260D2|nr:hypothetical protein [Hymenobacter sp. CA1UV-4]MDO7850394.1 hypothetical protein [Hymenobacter sp. CA1UV-4]
MKMLDHEHGAMNRLIKVTTASLWYLSEESTLGKAPALTELFDSYLPYWGNPPIAEMNATQRDVFTYELGRMGVVRVISVLDHYITALSAEIDAINNISGRTLLAISGKSNVDNDKPPRFIGFANSIGLSLTEREQALGEFVNVLRNCCAHRAGHASRKLVELLANKHVENELTIVSRRDRKKDWTATLPKLAIGDEIPINPIHAIWASSTCLNLARRIDAFVLDKLGKRGILCSAIHHLPKSYYLGKGMNTFDTAQAAINFLLSQMRVTGFQELSTIKMLREEGLWEKAVTAFDNIVS